MSRVHPEDLMSHSADTDETCAGSDLKCDSHDRVSALAEAVRTAAPVAVEARPYEPPQIVVIGKVRDLTSGSSSSGKSDANSQYYW